MPDLSLVVIRVSDLEGSRVWYECLGFTFTREQHGDGPVHYTATDTHCVFELYPESKTNPVTPYIRLGFDVPDVRAIVDNQVPSESVVSEPAMRFGRFGAVLVDPDGIKVEINEVKT